MPTRTYTAVPDSRHGSPPKCFLVWSTQTKRCRRTPVSPWFYYTTRRFVSYQKVLHLLLYHFLLLCIPFWSSKCLTISLLYIFGTITWSVCKRFGRTSGATMISSSSTSSLWNLLVWVQEVHGVKWAGFPIIGAFSCVGSESKKDFCKFRIILYWWPSDRAFQGSFLSIGS